jgi:hypothetical protein
MLVGSVGATLVAGWFVVPEADPKASKGTQESDLGRRTADRVIAAIVGQDSERWTQAR